MKTFDKLKENDLLLVKYYRQNEFRGHAHHITCRAKNVVLKVIEKLDHGVKKRLTFEMDGYWLEEYGTQTLEFTMGGLNDYKHVTFNAPGALEICCDPLYGINCKKSLLFDEIKELDSLVVKVIDKLLKK